MIPSSFSCLLGRTLLLLSCTALFPALSGAAEATSFASVTQLKGEVTATNKRGETRQLEKGAQVFVGEKLRSAANGEAVLQTRDAGIVAVRPNAEFIPERFAAEGKKTDHQILRLITGSLRIISGWIGQINRNEHRVITPTATIGIRGTDHEPFVLPATMARGTNPPGTYNKVNRGTTLLDANGGDVTIPGGKVGFAREIDASTESDTDTALKGRTRAMMTLLLPVLLDKIPDFYVPGAFDEELDRLSPLADANARRQFERLSGQRIDASAQAPTAPDILQGGNETTASNTTTATPTAVSGCEPQALGEVWLAQLDQAIAGRDIKTLLGLFAQDVVASATVQREGKLQTIAFARPEMVQSIISSVSSLKNYTQRRASIESKLEEGESPESCKRLRVKSALIEQGLMNDKPFRFESLEDYLLERRGGEWQAIKAHTTQR